MAKGNFLINKFNRGEVSHLAFAREDLEDIPYYAETMTNWMPRILGPMMVRPGTEFVGKTRGGGSKKAYYIPFVFNTVDDQAILEMTDTRMRVRIDEKIMERPAVSTSINNGTFAAQGSWTDESDANCTATFTSNRVRMNGTSFAHARVAQQVAVSASDRGKEHGVEVQVIRGSVKLRIGSAFEEDDFFNETELEEGWHNISFTPTDDFHIVISTSELYFCEVSICRIEEAGDVEVVCPWSEAELPKLRWEQSGDIIYIACKDKQQYKILRYDARSWAVVKYKPEDGPFRSINPTRITLTPSAKTGFITVTASENLFRPTHVGAVFKINSEGQDVDASVTGADQWTESVKVTGQYGNGTGDITSRTITINISGTWSGTVSLQKSVGDEGNWQDVKTYTANTTDEDYNDKRHNEIIYYRIGIDTGEYTSGTAVVSITFASGSLGGTFRVYKYVNQTTVRADVIDALGGTEPVDTWYEGQFSDRRGWPTAVVFADSRLCWVGRDKFNASVSDSFESFDDEVEGGSGPISRSLGPGPVDDVNWGISLHRLLLGGQDGEIEIRTTALDEPITPDNWNKKVASTQGSAAVPAVTYDQTGVYVQRSGKRIYELGYSRDQYANYQSDDLTKMLPNAAGDGNTFTRLAVQRQPDTRIHAVRSDGKVRINVRDKVEAVKGWLLFETDGYVEDAFTLPGDDEDKVYYAVRRTIEGVDYYYLERWALESQCQGGQTSRICDSHLHSSADVIQYGGLHFNGSTYLNGFAPSAGVIASKYASISLVCKFANDASAAEYVVGGNKFNILRTATGNIQVTGKDTGGNTDLDIVTTGTPCSSAGQYVIDIKFDNRGAGRAQIVVDGTSASVTETTVNDDFIAFNEETNFTFGADTSGANKFTGDIYMFYLNEEAVLNMTNSNVRAKFSNDSAIMYYMGANGEVPTGFASSYFFCYDDAPTWQNNKGDAVGVFTEIGSVEHVSQEFNGYAPTQSQTNSSVVSGVVTNLDHLEGKTVTAWGYLSGETAGKYLGDYTVSGGQITLDDVDTVECTVGLNYTAQYKGTKLAYAASMGTGINQQKIIGKVGIVGSNIIAGGLQYGDSFDTLDPLPVVERGEEYSDDWRYEEYDELLFPINGSHRTDPRLHLQCESPFAATIHAITVQINTHDTG